MSTSIAASTRALPTDLDVLMVGEVADYTDILLVRQGDLNGDNAVNNLDIAAFVTALVSETDYSLERPVLDADLLGDIDGDGVLTNLDIVGFVDLLTGSVPLTAEQTRLLSEPATPQAPEPGAALAFVLSALLLGTQRWRAPHPE